MICISLSKMLNPFFAIAISLTCEKRNAAQGLMSSQSAELTSKRIRH
jgi:hypothetical protein